MMPYNVTISLCDVEFVVIYMLDCMVLPGYIVRQYTMLKDVVRYVVGCYTMSM